MRPPRSSCRHSRQIVPRFRSRVRRCAHPSLVQPQRRTFDADREMAPVGQHRERSSIQDDHRTGPRRRWRRHGAPLGQGAAASEMPVADREDRFELVLAGEGEALSTISQPGSSVTRGGRLHGAHPGRRGAGPGRVARVSTTSRPARSDTTSSAPWRRRSAPRGRSGRPPRPGHSRPPASPRRQPGHPRTPASRRAPRRACALLQGMCLARLPLQSQATRFDPVDHDVEELRQTRGGQHSALRLDETRAVLMPAFRSRFTEEKQS